MWPSMFLLSVLFIFIASAPGKTSFGSVTLAAVQQPGVEELLDTSVEFSVSSSVPFMIDGCRDQKKCHTSDLHVWVGIYEGE